MNSTMRLGVVGIVFFALLGLLTLRLWTMQIGEVEAYEERALSNQSRVVATPAPRGDIYDRNGVKLAGTRSALAVVVDLLLVEEEERELLARNLAAFLDTPASEILDQFANDSQGGRVTVAEDISEVDATLIVEHREEFPGVSVIPQPVRTYPEGELAAHVIGYIGRPNEEDLEREDVKPTDVVGKAGVERSYDALLRGSEGAIEYRVDAKRKVLSLAGETVPQAGGSLVLTLDSALQEQLQDSLRDGLVQARRLEMRERADSLVERSRSERIADALAEAQEAALARFDEATGSTTTTTTTAEPGQDDDDVPAPPEEVTVDPLTVLGSLYPGLPIDDDGICVPTQRVTVAEGESGVLSGIEPRFLKVESIDTLDDDLVATVRIGTDRYTVSDNDSFAGTLQVLVVTEDEVIVYHRDRWCPVRSVGVVLDPNDGSVLAMGSYPSYDPSVFVGGISQTDFASLGTASALQNFAVQGLYAPASTFKAVPYVLALEESYYPLDRGVGDKEVGDEAPAEEESPDSAADSSAADSEGSNGDSETTDAAEEAEEPQPLLSDTDEYSCSGEFKFRLSDGTVQTKRDWKWPQGHGPLDLHGALQASCDLYFWDMALRLWDERNDETGVDKENLLQEYSRSLGFGTATGIDLPFERDGLVPDRAWFREEQRAETGRVRPDGPWVGGDLMDIAVGQGAMLSTPLQLANGYAAMVNGGTVWQPRVVDQIVDTDGEVVDEYPRVPLQQVDLDPRTVRMLRQDLQQVVNNAERGTARAAFADFGPNVEIVGGKTGTGEVIKAPRTEAFRQVDNAFFVGVAPINSPDYVVSIVVERGGSGGRVAAPVARQVLQYLVNGPEGVTELAPGLDAD
ncbi:MAG: penicillin-binding transpeptidase domain-containing protein [Acidimicrobiia bacterium]|nr:penicillin-binding transpeptidase domain-containing protein [Acidimicrobiia bacterium]